MGLINADIKDATSLFVDWKNKLKKQFNQDYEIVYESLGGTLQETLLQILPLVSGSPNRFIFVPCENGWTAYVNNIYRGTDGAALSYFSEELGCRTIHFVAIPHTLKGKGDKRKGLPGARIIKVWDPSENSHSILRRKLWLVNDVGKWEFEQEGIPFPFENTNLYKERKKSERFTFESMEFILENLGVRPFDQDFFKPGESTLVELKNWTLPGKPLLFPTIGEVRKYLRIVS